MSATWARSKSRGREALELVDYVTTNAAAELKHGQAQYSGLLYEHGGFVDDILVHKVADDHYLPVRECRRNQDKDFEHIRGVENQFDAKVDVRERSLRANRDSGAEARATLQKLTHADLAAIKYYWFADGKVAGAPARIARTGYTGEDGFEIYVAPDEAEATLERRFWRRAPSSASSRAAWARATRCAWKPRWRSTGTRSTRPSRRWKPIWLDREAR